jgi:CelD/BcsL family acetyltransferase involved in cellulose biosynthesis
VTSLSETTTVHWIDPLTDPRWDRALALPGARIFHTRAWLHVLADVYRFRVGALLATDAGDEVAGGVPFCEIDDCLGARRVSLPFSDACDPLLRSSGEWLCLAAEVRISELPFELKSTASPFAIEERSVSTLANARLQSLAVDEASAVTWRRLSEETRRGVGKSRRAGVDVQPLESTDQLRQFYRLHSALRLRKYGVLTPPQSFFESLARRFTQIGGWFPLGAFHNGRLIAATIYLRWRDTLYYKFNASDPDTLDLRPNNALVWAGLELASSLGCTTFDFGLSPIAQHGLSRFKRHFGASDQDLWTLRWTPAWWPSSAASNARDRLEAVLRRWTAPTIDEQAAARAGRRLYRFLA